MANLQVQPSNGHYLEEEAGEGRRGRYEKEGDGNVGTMGGKMMGVSEIVSCAHIVYTCALNRKQ